MSTPIAAASLMAFRSALKVAGLRAIYRRGADSVSVCVAPGAQSQTDQSVGGSSSFNAATADWEVEAAKLLIDSAEITPAPGDTLDVTTAAGETEFYQLALGPNRRVWDWGDNYHQIRTLHTVPKPPAS